MTHLRPLVIPVAAVMLAAGPASADARQHRSVDDVRASFPQPALPDAVAAAPDAGADASVVVPVAAPESTGDVAPPHTGHPVAAEPTGTAAAGRPAIATARGPPG